MVFTSKNKNIRLSQKINKTNQKITQVSDLRTPNPHAITKLVSSQFLISVSNSAKMGIKQDTNQLTLQVFKAGKSM